MTGNIQLSPDDVHDLLEVIDYRLAELQDELVHTGAIGWIAPCPPPGDDAHRYRFHVYALDEALVLAPGADRTAFEESIRGHVLAEDEVVARYRRPDTVTPAGT